MKKFFLSAAVLFTTPMMIAFCLIYLSFLSYQKASDANFSLKNSTVAYAALPEGANTFAASAQIQDARISIVRSFFQKYGSPLTPYAENVVEAADKYGLDYRLIPAIAMQESNLCKKEIKGSFNCWGFGIYGKKVTMFTDYPEAIDTVTKTLSKNYKANGLETPEEIMKKYTPGSNGSWANGVNYFMDELKTAL